MTKRRLARGLVPTVIAAAIYTLSGSALGQASSNISYTTAAEAINVTFSADALTKQNKNQGDVPAQSNYVGFKVTVSYPTGFSTNTVNNVVLRAASYIAPTVPAIDPATYATVAKIAGNKAVTCSTVTPPANWWTTEAGNSYYTIAASTYVECSIGQVKPGDSSEFIVYFNVPKAPSGVTSGNYPIQFLSKLSYAEGTNDSTGASRTDTQTFTPQPETKLGFGSSDPTTAGTSVPPNKSVALYTGLGVATAADPITTIIQINGVNTTATKATIEEGDRTCLSSTSSTTCVRSDIKIDGFSTPPSAPLIITLRRDVSTILSSTARIRDAKLYYYSDPSSSSYSEIGICAGGPLNGDVVLDPDGAKRCIWDRKEYGNSAQLGDFRSDWEFILKALENGRIAW